MKVKASYAWDRMSDKQLLDGMDTLLSEIQHGWTGGLTIRQTELKARAARDALHEVRLRGVQGRLWG